MIPRQLEMAIRKLQVAENLGWDEACVKAATLVDINSDRFQTLIEKKAQSLSKSRFLTQLNKGRATIARYSKRHGYLEGLESAKSIERFTIPCSKCGGPMEFQNNQNNWTSDVKPTLCKAFETWSHVTCTLTLKPKYRTIEDLLGSRPL